VANLGSTPSKALSLRSSFFVLALAAAPLACADGATNGSTAEQSGSIDLTLTTQGVSIDNVAFVITGPSGYSKSGNIDVSKSTSITTIIGSIPAGSGYAITLSAAPTTGASSCSGSAPFSVTAHQTTPVSVDLLCHETATTGSVLINGTVNLCAVLNNVSAVPSQAIVGGTVALSADATDADSAPSPLSYTWTATGGTLTGATTKNATLLCTAPGIVTATVSVSDGDPACTSPGSITVTCLSSGGTGGAGGMGAAGTGGTGGVTGNAGSGTSNGGSTSIAGGSGAAGAATGGAGAGGAGAAGAATGGAGAGGGGTSAGGAGAGGAGTSAGGAGASGAGAGGVAEGGAGAGGAAAGGAGAGAAGGSAGTRNVVVYRIGDGSGSLVNTGNPVFIDEFTSAGSPVSSTMLPVTASGTNQPLVASGTATSEGLITLSGDQHFVMLAGYASTIPASSSLPASTTVLRVVGRIDALHNVNTSTALTDWASGNNPRSVASTNGSDLWIAGAAGGIRYTTLGATTSTQLSTTVTNIRQTNIFASQLYVSDSSGTTSTSIRLGTVGSGLPTTSGQTITNLPGFANNTGSPYGFFFADLDSGTPGVDTLYVADDGAGITKYALTGGLWTAEGTVGTSSDAYRGLTGSVSGGSVTLFATRKGGSGATGGGELVSIVDATGPLGTFAATPTLLVTAPANEAFRGVAFAPLP
jgi:hypothetical protein